MSAPLDLLPSVSRDDIRRKKMEKTEEEKAKQQQEEEGLPEEEKEEAGKKSVAAVTGDAGVGWLRRAYKRCEEMAAEEGRTLDEVAAERYGSLAKLKKMLSEAEKTLERLKEEERQERYGRREDDRRGRQRDHHGRSSDGGRRWEGRDRDRTPPRDRDRAKYGSRDRGSDRDRARGNRDLHGEDRPRRRFMKPGCDNDNGGQHSSRGREDHSPGRQRRGFLKPGKDTERQSSSREPRREKPSFKRPADDDDGIDAMFEQRRAELKTRSRSPHQEEGVGSEGKTTEQLRGLRFGCYSIFNNSGSAQSESESSSEEEEQTSSPAASQPAHAPPKILTEEEMNRLGAKVLRAEMMGNETLAAELKQQLDEARKTKASTGACPQGGVAAREGEGAGTKEGEEVVLTRTDRSGMVRPLPAREYPDESHSGKRRKKPKVATHAKGGERERYFDDDDSYSLKALVEREKLGTAEDQNTMFARLAGRSVEATNDDYQVDDVFVSRAARHQSQSHVETRERQLAIIEHKQMAASLEKCSYCFEKVPKHLIISIGKKVYLCLPNYRSMTEGHCLIVPMMHATQATALDEDVWEEIQVFRKALTRMYTEKALLECDTEWTENKKVVDLSQKDVRRAEIVGGMLDLEPAMCLGL
ncbi:hypothetical protein NP493_341g01024 [Ridgeia piscesae]|uniref:Cwf19-like C-terminal domain-containing protein n=1 Tax=Ridgeia piscesae TaxID=27915 RepID=A0AAD9L409_RIDPI|nr:hypothetical protein NP493_341g01024 [Ridgeia piscesae]